MSYRVKRDPVLDQFSMIARPYTRLNGLKTIPFPAGHTHIANIWEYPPPPPQGRGEGEEPKGKMGRKQESEQKGGNGPEN